MSSRLKESSDGSKLKQIPSNDLPLTRTIKKKSNFHLDLEFISSDDDDEIF
jgi:hypothetical protein